MKRQGHEKANGQNVFAVEEGSDGGVGLGLHQLQDLQQTEAVSAGVMIHEGLVTTAPAAESLLNMHSSTCSSRDQAHALMRAWRCDLATLYDRL